MKYEQIKFFFERFTNGDPSDTSYRRALVDVFINRIELSDDYLIIYYNANDGQKINVPLGEPKGSPKGLYCKGRFYDRNLQAVLLFAAQTDGHPQERNGTSSGTSGTRRKRATPQEHFTHAYVVKKCRVKSQILFEKGSVLPPLFLPLVRGSSSITRQSDYPSKKQKGAQTSLSATVYQVYQQSKRGNVQCRP